jgi:NAD(P) transhydrogenase subunit alpha
MKPGSVIVDLAGETGGNCELTVPGETTIAHGVTIMSPRNLASQVAEHASSLYARNVQALLDLMLKTPEGAAEPVIELDYEDEIIAGATITRAGEIVHEGAKRTVEANS